MALYLSNETQKKSKTCVVQTDNSRKDTEDFLTDLPYRAMDPKRMWIPLPPRYRPFGLCIS